MIITPPSNSRSGQAPSTLDLHTSLVRKFLSESVTARSVQLLAFAGSAARHFLRWLADHRIPIEIVDDGIVERFGRHRCRCPRYSQRQLREPAYLGQVRRFICFLERQGAIVAVGDPAIVDVHFEAFARDLIKLGYSRGTRLSYSAQGRHFAAWLRLSRIRWSDVDDRVIERFAHHDCRCPIKAKRGIRAPVTGPAHRRRGAERFIAYLQDHGVITPRSPAPGGPPEDARLTAYRNWLEQDRGATDATIRRYIGEASRWLSTLGSDPAGYAVMTIRSIALEQAGRSRASVYCDGCNAPIGL